MALAEVFVLAGGASSRMGVDKARVPWWHEGNWEPLARVLSLRHNATLVRPQRSEDPWDVPVIREPEHEGFHPLWGVAAALSAAQSETVGVLPCDVWLPEVELSGEPWVASFEGVLHPLVGVFPASWASRAQTFAEEGRSARAWVEGVRVQELGSLQTFDRPEQLPDTPWARLAPLMGLLGPRRARSVVDGEVARLGARGVLDPLCLAAVSCAFEREGVRS